MKKFAMFIIAIMMMASVCGCSAVTESSNLEGFTVSQSFSDGSKVVDEDANQKLASLQLYEAWHNN